MPLARTLTIHARPSRLLGMLLAGVIGHVGVVPASLAAQTAGGTQTERDTRTVQAGSTPILDLSNVAGDISITGGNTAEITIRASRPIRGADEDAAQPSGAWVRVVERGQRVEVRTVGTRRSGQGDGQREGIDYDVTVPVGTTLDIHSVSGDIQVRDVNGELRLETVSGDVQTESASQEIVAKSVSGEVEVRSSGDQADVTATSVSGSVIATGLRARRLTVKTVSGDLTLTDATCERVEASSMSGELEYTGDLLQNGRYELKSHSGDVNLTVSEAVGFEVEARSFSGDVESDFALDTSRGRDRRSRGREVLEGRHGDGSAFVEINTFSGDITIAKR